MKYFRRIFVLIVITGITCHVLEAQTSYPLAVERRGQYLRLAAPQMHFLEGKPLERLHNGASVTYVLQATLAQDQRSAPLTRLRERFILSFDLWEERFAVVQAGPPGRSGSHLTAAAAEAWCLENLQVPITALTPEKPFVIKLECWVEQAEPNGGDAGLTLAGLIDVLSRKGRDAQPRWQAVSGALRLAELK